MSKLNIATYIPFNSPRMPPVHLYFLWWLNGMGGKNNPKGIYKEEVVFVIILLYGCLNHAFIYHLLHTYVEK